MDSLLNQNTAEWRFQVWMAFLLAFGLTISGVFMLEVNWWVKGYMLMGLVFLTSSCFALAKTLRDDKEITRTINRISDAKTQKIIKDYEE